MAEFLNMGGYAGFIWPAWGIGVLIFVLVSLRSVLSARLVRAQLSVRASAQLSAQSSGLGEGNGSDG